MPGRLISIVSLVCILASCTDRWSAYATGSPGRRKELATLFSLLDETADKDIRETYRERFALSHKIASIYIGEKKYSRLATFLTVLPSRLENRGKVIPTFGASARPATPRPQDPYAAWYLYTAAAAYEREGALPVAALYYDRAVKSCPDILVGGQSIHYLCLSRLIETTSAPERRIAYYSDMMKRFADRMDAGRIAFLLGKEYEKIGEWDKAIAAYRDFLPWFGTTVPGYADAFQYARNLVELNSSPRNWTRPDLESLLVDIRRTLASGSAIQLRKLTSKVGFFAVSWHQGDETDANSQVLFDFAEFMNKGNISVASSLDPSSGDREAYLRTSGWRGSLPIWYLYFRKMDFPADPETHGNWEWAGIYFGEKMR